MDFHVSDELNGTIVEKAADFLNSGTISFDVISADGNSAATLSVIVVHLGDPSLVSSGARGYAHMNSTGLSGVGTVWTLPDRMKGFTYRARLDKQITNLVHEALHLDEDIDRQRAKISSDLAALGVDVSNTRAQVIIEEKLIRDAISIIDKLSPDFRPRGHYDSINKIIHSYGRGELSNAEKQSIRDYFNSSYYKTPTVKFNGSVYGVNVNDSLVEYRNTKEVIVEEISENRHCLISDSSIQTSPLDSSLKSPSDGTYDEKLILSKTWEKPVSGIRAGNLVVPYHDNVRIESDPVTGIMTSTDTHLLDFWDTDTSLGHAHHCDGDESRGQYVALIDTPRVEGTVMRAVGPLIHAATDFEVCSMGDMMRVEDDMVEERVFRFPYSYGAELPQP